MNESRQDNHPERAAFRIVLIYALFAALWILFSDTATEVMFSAPAQLVQVSMVKGWLFVAVTSALLYGLVRRMQDRLIAANRRESELQAEKMRALQLIRTIAEGSDDAIFAKDLEGRYILINRAACNFVDRTPEEILGHDDRAIFPAEQAAMLMDFAAQVIRENRPSSREELLSTPGGDRVFYATKGPLHDAEGQTIGIFGISRDITARKLAEEELRRNNEELLRFNRASIGRELDMIELKKQVNALSLALGQAAPYSLGFLDAGEGAVTGNANP